MNKIEADVLIETESELGLYVEAVPTTRSRIEISRLLRTAPFQTTEADDLHCTVLYCESSPAEIVIPEPTRLKAYLKGLTVWKMETHDYMVLLLDSSDLCATHRRLVKQGARHSFSQYNPHLTVGRDVVITSEVAHWILDLNAVLAAYKMPINFRPMLHTAHLEK